MRDPSRRDIMASGAAFAVAPRAEAAAPVGDADRMGETLLPWRPGTLDIHHLSTGRGDATLIVAPDGRTALIDAGAASRVTAATLPQRPASDQRPGQTIARYVTRRLRETQGNSLNVLAVSHLHPDHTGGVTADAPTRDNHRLTGVADVAAVLPVDLLMDPYHPHYGIHPFEDEAAARNYVAFVTDREARGERVVSLTVGRADQILPSVPGLEIRTLAANGRVWTGTGTETRQVFPPDSQAGENARSAAFRLSYGPFRYFAGGDLTDGGEDGRNGFDALTAAARACGRVSVATAPHHGLFDATGPEAVKSLAARVWVISTWHASHPSPSTLDRLFSSTLYPGQRQVYVTALSQAAELTSDRFTSRLASKSGHIVIRVTAGGDLFRVVVTSDADEDDRVLSLSEPIPSLPARRSTALSSRHSDFLEGASA